MEKPSSSSSPTTKKPKKNSNNNNNTIPFMTKEDFEGLKFPTEDPLRFNILAFVAGVASQTLEKFKNNNNNNVVNNIVRDNKSTVAVVDHGGQPALPRAFRRAMESLGGTDPRLVIRKRLFNSDVKTTSTRLSIPFNQIVDSEFLSSGEKTFLGKRKSSLEVFMIDPAVDVITSGLKLSRWDMEKPNHRVNSHYVINGSWYKEVVVKNNLEVHDKVHLWSFRSRLGNIAFALVLLSKGQK